MCCGNPDGDDCRPTTQLGCSRLCWHARRRLAAAATSSSQLSQSAIRALVDGSVVVHSTVIASLIETGRIEHVDPVGDIADVLSRLDLHRNARSQDVSLSTLRIKT